MKPISYKKQLIGNYSVAPYNFVSLPEKAVARYKSYRDLPPHNNFRNREGQPLLSGTIEYTLTAQTPIIVSAGQVGNDAFPFVNAGGDYAIPGNTIKGLLRTNSSILSYSNIIRSGSETDSEIENARFLFRDVASNNSLAKKYKEILDIDANKRIARNLRAGYVSNEDGKYLIRESERLDADRAYFRISEIRLRQIIDDNVVDRVSFLYTEGLQGHEAEIKELNKIIHPNKGLPDKTRALTARRRKFDILKLYSNEANYKPYNCEISFDYGGKDNKVLRIGKKGKYAKNGYLLSGGFIAGKMSHYVVAAPGVAAGEIVISPEDITTYKDDLILTKKMIKENETINKGFEFFDLPSKGYTKPVFFINTDRLHFGFTPYLRMFHSKTIFDGVDLRYKDVRGISYADSIFGFSNLPGEANDKKEKISYKARVSCEDAVAYKGAILDQESRVKMLLAEPKPTSFNLYLKQNLDADKQELNIYEGDFSIRGVKQYWLKDYVEGPIIGEGKAENMTFFLNPLKEGVSFDGKIHFVNLEEDELGLLLWALVLEEGCYQNIGLAKPYGFGRVKVEDVKLQIENLEKKYGEFSFDYLETSDTKKFIDIYKRTFSRECLFGGKWVEDMDSIKEFIHIKKEVVGLEDANYYRYMDLDLKEFRDRKVLPSILRYASAIKAGPSVGLQPLGKPGGGIYPQNKPGVGGPNPKVKTNDGVNSKPKKQPPRNADHNGVASKGTVNNRGAGEQLSNKIDFTAWLNKNERNNQEKK